MIADEIKFCPLLLLFYERQRVSKAPILIFHRRYKNMIKRIDTNRQSINISAKRVHANTPTKRFFRVSRNYYFRISAMSDICLICIRLMLEKVCKKSGTPNLVI